MTHVAPHKHRFAHTQKRNGVSHGLLSLMVENCNINACQEIQILLERHKIRHGYKFISEPRFALIDYLPGVLLVTIRQRRIYFYGLIFERQQAFERFDVVVAWVCRVAEEYVQAIMIGGWAWLHDHFGIDYITQVHDAFMMGAPGSVPLAGKLYISFDVRYQMADPADYQSSERFLKSRPP